MALVALGLVVSGCVAGEVALEAAPSAQDETEPINGPEIIVFVRSHGGDAIEVYLEGSASDRRAIAEGAAAWLGFPNRIAHEHPFYEDTSTVEIDERIIEPASGDNWVLVVNTSPLNAILRSTGYREAGLVFCTPAVETQIRASRPSDLEFEIPPCDSGNHGWVLLASETPLQVRMTFLPEPVDYLAYAAAVLLGVLLFGTLSWWISDRLRRGPFRRRSAASVAIGLIGGAFATIGLAVVTGVVGALAGPADNLALARDFNAAGYASSLLWPALLATTPGIIFATLLIRRRPWADEEEPISPIPPGAPGVPGAPAAPPLPWSGG